MLPKKLFLSSTVLFVLVTLLFIGSVDASSEMWSQTYGGEGAEKAYSLVETSDGGYALGGYTYSLDTEESDVWLVKTDVYGNMMWNQTYEGEAYALVQTSDGGYALTGQKDGDFWLAKTDAQGIIPEFPSWTPLLVALTAVLVVAVIYRHSLNKCNQERRKSEKSASLLTLLTLTVLHETSTKIIAEKVLAVFSRIIKSQG